MKESRGTEKQSGEKRSRVYVCHTYYHVYVTLLKEMNIRRQEGEADRADLVLSRMSSELINEDFIERVRRSGIFGEVLLLDERRDSEFPELRKYRETTGGFVRKLWRRMLLCRKFPRRLENCIDVDFTRYREIYVYCDADPIGYYLNYKKIPYHAVEDGLDCNRDFDMVRHFNRKFWGLKCLLAKWGLIFMENGYSRYALDMEVNDLACIAYRHRNWKAVPRERLKQALTDGEKKMIFAVFVKDAQGLLDQCGGRDRVLILTQPLCELNVRERIFRDIIAEYGEGAQVILKPHPRDELDYERLFPECIVLEGKFPVEVLNFHPGFHFKRVISVVTTAIDAIEFADEKINLGMDFLDRYEDPAVHRY